MAVVSGIIAASSFGLRAVVMVGLETAIGSIGAALSVPLDLSAIFE